MVEKSIVALRSLMHCIVVRQDFDCTCSAIQSVDDFAKLFNGSN